MTRYQHEPDDDDELDDDEPDDDGELDDEWKEIIEDFRGAGAAQGSNPPPSVPAQSFGDVFWDKNCLVALKVTTYLGATCVVLVFLFFVAVVAKALFR